MISLLKNFLQSLSNSGKLLKLISRSWKPNWMPWELPGHREGFRSGIKNNAGIKAGILLRSGAFNGFDDHRGATFNVQDMNKINALLLICEIDRYD